MSTHLAFSSALALPRGVLRLLAAALLFAAPLCAQIWETSAGHPGDPKYHQPDYLLAFVANRGHADPATDTPPHLGLDVHATNNPSAHGPGGGLYVLLPNGQVARLFPLSVHESAPGLIDTPLGELEKGAVVEPNVSEDGRTLYFAYFHDATWEPNGGGFQSKRLSYKGSDLYRLDVGPLLDDPGFDPAALAIRRLTFKEYTGPAKSNVTQTDPDRFKDATNPSLAQAAAGAHYWGTVDMHLIEMRTSAGLKAVWVSNRARLANANEWFGDANQNFNLYQADIRPDGSLGPPNPFQYYTTTSALSPTPLRDGFAFAYQSSTDDGRRWDIQSLDSEGRWKTLIGYAHSSELFHLGTLAVERDASGGLVDTFIGVKYYNANNDGFGQLQKIRLEDAGINEFVPGPWGTSPRQLSELLTLGTAATDIPSSQVTVGGQLLYIGKFSSPRAGRVGGEYFMAYTPTSANVHRLDADSRKNIFESEIRYRPDLEPFEPREAINVAQGRGLYTVVREASTQYDLVWPTPLLSWLERTGEARQRVAEPIVDPHNEIPAGMPLAEIGAPALWNSDIRPYDCYMRPGRVFQPNALDSNEVVQVLHSQEGLRYVQDPTDFCQYLAPETVLGIGVNLTSQRTDFQALAARGYETDGGGKVESVEPLGFYSVLAQNDADQSFKVRLPANVPFEFHLIDRRYGMKLADVRSWHSLKPRETRTDCGGCHQHEAGFGLPFEGTEAAGKPAFDMTQRTTFVDYDADCRPIVATSQTPTLVTSEWQADIWPGFDQHCGDCHNVVRSTNSAAMLAFDYGTEENAYNRLKARNYAGSLLGALGSPAFWAAYGERTDGRDNDLPAYIPDYAESVWGYHFSSVHASSPGLCAASNPEWARWVRRFGQWIDNHMPRDTGATVFGAKYDRYAPTVEFALSQDLETLAVGYWDDRGAAELTLEFNGNALAFFPSRPNGSVTVALPASWSPTDLVRVVARDPTDNRQVQVKSLSTLLQERLAGRVPSDLVGRGTANTRPSVVITSPADHSHPPVGSPIALAARASDLEDGELGAELAWASDLEGALGTGASLVVLLLQPGPHRITARVFDSLGRVGSDSVEIVLEAFNAPPTVTISAPQSGAIFSAGSSIVFVAGATDPEDDDGVLSASIAWSSSLQGPLGSGSSFATSALNSGTHAITASVTDSGGANAADSIVVVIEVVDPILPTTGLVLHLESTTGVSTSGNAVTTWLDQSGNGNDLFAFGGPALAPALTPSGRPALVLDGSNDKLERVHASTPILGLPSGNADRTMFVVTRYNGLTWSAGATYGNGAGNQTFGPGVRHTNGALMLMGYGNEHDLESTTPGLGAGWLVQAALLESEVATLFKDDAPIAQWPHTYDTVRSKIVLGQEIAGSGWVAMDVAAVLIYDRALPAAERQAVNTYLREKYIAAANAPATVTIHSPTDGAHFDLGAAVRLDASASDPEDGDLTSAISWTSDRDGMLGSGSPLTLTTLSIGSHRVSAAVLDSAGRSAQASVTVVISDPGVITPTSPLTLFDGQSLAGLEPWFSGFGNADPNQVFRVEGGLLRVTGNGWGGLTTLGSYRDYALVLEYKWGEATWAPRLGGARDAGLLIHSHGTEGEWGGLLLPGLQAQIMEGSTGDFILLEGNTPILAMGLSEQVPCTFGTWNCRGGYRWNAAGVPQPLEAIPGTTLHWNRWDPDWVDAQGFRGDEDVDSAQGDWNQLLVVAAGDTAEVFLNGVQVNAVFGVVPSAGRIQLEVEFAEYFVRRLELLPLGTPVGPTVATAALLPGTAGQGYSATLIAVAGLGSRTWSLVSGLLPTGLSLEPSTGLISGVPEAEGSFPFVVRVTDAQGLSAEAAFELVVSPAASALPTDGLVLQLESTEFVSAGPVTSWSDQSGRGNHVFASGDPVVALTATPAGRPAVVLAGLNDRLERLHASQALTGLPTGNADRSMFLVARYDGCNASSGSAYGRGGTGQAFGLVLRCPTGKLALQGWAEDLDSSAPGLGAGWLTQSAVLAGGQARLFKDGAQIAQWSHAYNTTLEKLVIGVEIANIGFVDMQVAAVLIYDRALSDQERFEVEAYLNDKYLR